MKSLALSLAVLLCVSVASATPGYEYTYVFDQLGGTLGQPLDLQVDDAQNVTWAGVVNIGQCFKQSAATGPKEAYSDTKKQERIYALPTTGSTIFTGVSSTDTYFRFSYDCNMRLNQGSYIGIYCDLDPNADPVTNDSETLLQVGIGTYKSTWRIRGAGGANSRYADPNWTAVYNANLKPMTVQVYIDLAGNYGDGSLWLVINDGSGWVTPRDKDTGNPMVNMPMGLMSKDPIFSDPTNWTGFAMRGQQGATNDPNDDPNWPGPMTFDNLRLEVLPEPATLTLLALGGLACIRRRR